MTATSGPVTSRIRPAPRAMHRPFPHDPAWPTLDRSAVTGPPAQQWPSVAPPDRSRRQGHGWAKRTVDKALFSIRHGGEAAHSIRDSFV